ncbi:hypothetical protein E2C01_068603 [Portunus trituberculatus]|uniref:Uncharacterized protein n=1 Tax=Portunus trituberculatus TaxID=210409 RepID=A0A5B7HWW2_PORTR|nr:hypothetical protein [Portunus trituberculatus]
MSKNRQSFVGHQKNIIQEHQRDITNHRHVPLITQHLQKFAQIALEVLKGSCESLEALLVQTRTKATGTWQGGDGRW